MSHPPTAAAAAAEVANAKEATTLLRDATNTVSTNGADTELIQSLLARMDRLEQVQAQSTQSILNAMSEMKRQQEHQFQLLSGNISRYLEGLVQSSSARQEVHANRGQTASTPNKTSEAPPTLSKMPRDLNALWKEYQFGLNGRKAARLFTTTERNINRKIKQKYYRRNQIWQCMKKQIHRGLTPEEAVQELYAVYGSKSSVSQIIELVIADKKRYQDSGGYHPNLSV